MQHDDPPPPQSPRRILFARPEPWDAWYLGRTSDELFAEPDLDLWLSDDLEEDHDVGVVVRQGLPGDVPAALQLLRHTPPRAMEVFPVRIGLAKRILDSIPDDQRFAFRDDEVSMVGDATRLRPGDIVIVATTTRCFRSGVVDEDGGDTADDVLERGIAGYEPAILRLGVGAPSDPGGGAMAELLEAIGSLLDELPKDGREWRRRLAAEVRDFADALSGADRERLRDSARDLERSRLNDVDVVLGPDSPEGTPAWVVVADTHRWSGDDALRQTWTRERDRVTLTRHQRAVAERVAHIAAQLTLDPILGPILREAAELHDEGKRDARFQSSLWGASPDARLEALAKSGIRSPSESRAARTQSGLPDAWRHEQLSAAHVWAAYGARSEPERRLVSRLVGTSHGWGRSSFPHDASGLTGPEDRHLAAARELFDEGAWDAIIEGTEAEWGVWGCAYLEALVRAADGQVSGEGG